MGIHKVTDYLGPCNLTFCLFFVADRHYLKKIITFLQKLIVNPERKKVCGIVQLIIGS